MLAWVVIDRTYSRQFLAKSSSPRTLCLCVEFSDSFRPTSFVPPTYALPPRNGRSSTPLQSIRYALFLSRRRVDTPSGAALTTATLSNAYTKFPISFIFNPVRTLLHFFALIKNSTLLLSSDSALFTKNTGGGVSLSPNGSRPGKRGICLVLTSLLPSIPTSPTSRNSNALPAAMGAAAERACRLQERRSSRLFCCQQKLRQGSHLPGGGAGAACSKCLIPCLPGPPCVTV